MRGLSTHCGWRLVKLHFELNLSFFRVLLLTKKKLKMSDIEPVQNIEEKAAEAKKEQKKAEPKEHF